MYMYKKKMRTYKTLTVYSTSYVCERARGKSSGKK